MAIVPSCVNAGIQLEHALLVFESMRSPANFEPRVYRDSRQKHAHFQIENLGLIDEI